MNVCINSRDIRHKKCLFHRNYHTSPLYLSKRLKFVKTNNYESNVNLRIALL